MHAARFRHFKTYTGIGCNLLIKLTESSRALKRISNRHAGPTEYDDVSMSHCFLAFRGNTVPSSPRVHESNDSTCTP
jgi:hypothetical protein